jgi:phospholipid/cholesterol/gamma-HCH transport system ATP-binding protein
MSEVKDCAIRVKDLVKSFDGKEEVLKGINLDIPKGKITFIIGFSGTGKSVLLKHLLGIFKPTSGTVNVLGKDLSKLTHDQTIEVRKNFGVLFQGAALFDDQTVIENVLFPLDEHRRDLKKAERLTIASSRLKLVGIDEKHFQKLPSQISGGMQKRVGLARAIALNPEILLYDEPTTGLDPILTEMVDNLIIETHKHQEGITSIVVSHDLTAAFRLADYIAMLDSGKVLLFGIPQEFLDSDNALIRKFVDKGIQRK